MSYKLGLAKLQEKLLHFMHTNTLWENSILNLDILESLVFTDRIMAAIGAREVKLGFIRDLLGECCGFGAEGLVKAVDKREYSSSLHPTHHGKLRRYMGTEAGSWLSLWVDPVEDCVTLRNQEIPARLVLGRLGASR